MYFFEGGILAFQHKSCSLIWVLNGKRLLTQVHSLVGIVLYHNFPTCRMPGRQQGFFNRMSCFHEALNQLLSDTWHHAQEMNSSCVTQWTLCTGRSLLCCRATTAAPSVCKSKFSVLHNKSIKAVPYLSILCLHSCNYCLNTWAKNCDACSSAVIIVWERDH